MNAASLQGSQRRLVAIASFLLVAATLSQAAHAISDTLTLTAGETTTGGGLDTYFGFESGKIGSITPTTTSDGYPITVLDDYSVCSGVKGHPCGQYSNLQVSGFQADPGQGWLASVAAHGLTLTGAAASYSYSGGVASWRWVGTANLFNFSSGSRYTVVLVHSLSGHINPKYIIVGVTYAPPGPSNSTFVNYTASTFVGNTLSLSNSFGSTVSSTVSASKGFSVEGIKGSVTTSTTEMVSVTTENDSSITTSFEVANGEQTGGTGSYFAPVDHDYDQIWVWLNPLLLFSVGPHSVVWNGYAYDANDQAGMDVVPIPLGYLNGDFGAMPPDIQTSLNRSWAAGYQWPAGDGPALTSADLATIAAADPFSADEYGTNYIGYTPPSPETSDHRFTVSACSDSSSFDYQQAAPSQTPDIYKCTLAYTNMSTAAQSITNTTTQIFAEDLSIGGGFLGNFNLDVKTSQTLTWTTKSQSSITNTNTSTAALQVQGPPCNNTVSEEGPCVPVYDAAGNQPTQFDVYQDNMFGTFMFAPVHYY
jgi:hypothetical protein